jgi:hypothetical protein
LMCRRKDSTVAISVCGGGQCKAGIAHPLTLTLHSPPDSHNRGTRPSSLWRSIPTHQPPTPRGPGPGRAPTMAFRASWALDSGLLLSTAWSSSGYLVMRWWGLISRSPSICLPARLCFSHHCRGRWAGVQESVNTLCPAPMTNSTLDLVGAWTGPSCPIAPFPFPLQPAQRCGREGWCLAAPGRKPWSSSLACSTGHRAGIAGQTGGINIGGQTATGGRKP